MATGTTVACITGHWEDGVSKIIWAHGAWDTWSIYTLSLSNAYSLAQTVPKPMKMECWNSPHDVSENVCLESNQAVFIASWMIHPLWSSDLIGSHHTPTSLALMHSNLPTVRRSRDLRTCLDKIVPLHVFLADSNHHHWKCDNSKSNGPIGMKQKIVLAILVGHLWVVLDRMKITIYLGTSLYEV